MKWHNKHYSNLNTIQRIQYNKLNNEICISNKMNLRTFQCKNLNEFILYRIKCRGTIFEQFNRFQNSKKNCWKCFTKFLMKYDGILLVMWSLLFNASIWPLRAFTASIHFMPINAVFRACEHRNKGSFSKWWHVIIAIKQAKDNNKIERLWKARNWLTSNDSTDVYHEVTSCEGLWLASI